MNLKIAKLALALLAGIGAGCATAPSAPPVSVSALPDCFASNYDAQRALFTIKGAVGDTANQQCLLTVGPRADAAPTSSLTAGSYLVSLANGGGGGAGGTVQVIGEGGGGGGGGAGAMETRATVNLAEGAYKLTIGGGGPGGNACVRGSFVFDGGPGWAGSPSNIVRVASGEVVAGPPGADSYVRPTRARNEGLSGKLRDGHGGSGPGQASGGHGGFTGPTGAKAEATSGESKASLVGAGAGGDPGVVPRDDQRSGSGGGGGATSIGDGGDGGGERAGNKDIAPERGSLGSGGGGGVGNSSGCEAGARGGHGFIALRPL